MKARTFDALLREAFEAGFDSCAWEAGSNRTVDERYKEWRQKLSGLGDFVERQPSMDVSVPSWRSETGT